jgi:epoxyqueuosine reductase
MIVKSSLFERLEALSQNLGFQQLGITDTELPEAKVRLREWIALGYHGEMKYMSRYGDKRADPAAIVPDTKRVLVVRMDYLPTDPAFDEVLNNPHKAFVSRYAQGRDYHKLMRKRLQKLATEVLTLSGEFQTPVQTRVFVDSGPILEKPLAVKAGLGWIGKNTMLIHPKAGSFFFLGTLLTNLALPLSAPFTEQHCGRCTACIEICPTQAIVAPGVLDARRCISYLTIEFKGEIPLEFRKAMGNRIYGCDDCQIVCPWNKFAKASAELEFQAIRGFHSPTLLELFAWDEATFLRRTEGSAIRRIGYESWQRNLAVALGNAPPSDAIRAALQAKLIEASPLVAHHIEWALQEQQGP